MTSEVSESGYFLKLFLKVLMEGASRGNLAYIVLIKLKGKIKSSLFSL